MTFSAAGSCSEGIAVRVARAEFETMLIVACIVALRVRHFVSQTLRGSRTRCCFRGNIASEALRGAALSVLLTMVGTRAAQSLGITRLDCGVGLPYYIDISPL